MKNSGGESKKGFTIIEVSLVLAIAGLIFLMVVLALPAVQRTEWDARRQDDIANFLDALKKYQTANRGALPVGTGVVDLNNVGVSGYNASWATFYKDYLGDNFTDPHSGEQYKLRIAECGTKTTGVKCTVEYPKTNEENTIMVVTQATCGGDDGQNYAIRSSNPRKVAAMYQMEIGTIYCANS